MAVANITDFIKNRIPDEGMPKQVITLKGFAEPLEVEVQGLTTEEQLQIVRSSTVVYPPAVPGGESKEGLDIYKVTARQIIAGAVSVDFRSRELQRAFGAKDQIDLVYKMFNDEDRNLILTTLTELSQEAPQTAGTPEEDVKTAKN